MTVAPMTARAQTVLGPVDAEHLGVTITHEHLLIHARHIAKEPAEASQRAFYRAPVSLEIIGRLRFGRLVNLDNCQLTSIEAAIGETRLFKQAGGGTIVDATSIGIGRDPAGLAAIARATGLHIVMGSSYYIEETHPTERRVGERSEEEIAEEITRDILEEVDGAGIRAGLIGEVGCSWPLTDTERKVLRASARAQRMTGAPLMIHPGRDQTAPMEIIAILDRDLSRTIMCHIDRTIDRAEPLAELAATGCVLEYDLFGYEQSYYPWSLPVDMPNDAGRLRWLRWLIDRGYGTQVLVSHDICFKDKLARYGGHGYAHILENVVPLMRRKEFTDDEIRMILVDNPKRLLAFA
jgi:phosphotriesterase-related protein